MQAAGGVVWNLLAKEAGHLYILAEILYNSILVKVYFSYFKYERITGGIYGHHRDINERDAGLL